MSKPPGRVITALPFKTPVDIQVHYPSWSPDGRYLVYDSAGGIVIADVASGAEKIVSTSGAHPDWDPLDLGP
jgi:Tol biopolymer transport system component